jgi:hypothetical protein
MVPLRLAGRSLLCVAVSASEGRACRHAACCCRPPAMPLPSPVCLFRAYLGEHPRGGQPLSVHPRSTVAGRARRLPMILPLSREMPRHRRKALRSDGARLKGGIDQDTPESLM